MPPALAATASACSSTAFSVERVDLRRFGRSAGVGDRPGHLFELGGAAAGEVDLRSLTGEDTGHRAADRASPSVDDRVLVLEQHV